MSGSPVTLTERRLLASFRGPAASTPTRIGVIADPHLSTRAEGTWKCYGRTESRLASAVRTVEAADVDRVLVAGDLTKDGEPWNFDRFDELTGGLSAPVDVVPGNHDVPKAAFDHEVAPVTEFEARYAPDGLPFATRAGDLTLVGLNSATLPDGALHDTWGGAVSAEQLEWLDGVLADAATPLVAVHHNVYRLPEHDGSAWENFRLRNGGALHDLLAEHGVELVLSAHHHVPATTRASGVREVIVPAVCSFPQAVVTVDIDERGTRVALHPVATAPEQAEAYAAAMNGSAVGQSIATLAETRLRRLPLVEE